MQTEPRCACILSPCYVVGDMHGNLEDLHFSDNTMSLTAGHFLFWVIMIEENHV